MRDRWRAGVNPESDLQKTVHTENTEVSQSRTPVLANQAKPTSHIDQTASLQHNRSALDFRRKE